jgi:hypothetical protein
MGTGTLVCVQVHVTTNTNTTSTGVLCTCNGKLCNARHQARQTYNRHIGEQRVYYTAADSIATAAAQQHMISRLTTATLFFITVLCINER